MRPRLFIPKPTLYCAPSITPRKNMNTPSDISLTKIGQISVNVHDLDRVTAFYKDILGMKHLFSVPPQMAFFDCDGIRLMLAIPERPDLDHPSSILYFKVQNIEETDRVLEERGIHFEAKPMLVAPMVTHDLWLAEFRDSENNVLALMCEKPKAVTSDRK
jgi:predicted enzyme related to lactoylglutathione lyase